VIEDEPTLVMQAVTRRERRIERTRARRRHVRVGWFSYGLSVVAVIGAASWLAVRGDSVVAPNHAPATTQSTAPAAALQPVTSTSGAQTQTVAVSPPTVQTAAPVVTTTTVPAVVAAVATPTP
jgi:hypothetical protein